MSVEVKGIKELERQLEAMYGQQRMKQLSDEALRPSAKIVANQIASNFQSFKDTGASIDEIHMDKPSFAPDGTRRVIIRWKGPKDRYRIIHLNEFGYNRNGKRITPAGFGAIARALRASERSYRQSIIKYLRRGIT